MDGRPTYIDIYKYQVGKGKLYGISSYSIKQSKSS
jgi:hypothetical protein